MKSEQYKHTVKHEFSKHFHNGSDFSRELDLRMWAITETERFVHLSHLHPIDCQAMPVTTWRQGNALRIPGLSHLSSGASLTLACFTLNPFDDFLAIIKLWLLTRCRLGSVNGIHRDMPARKCEGGLSRVKIERSTGSNQDLIEEQK